MFKAQIPFLYVDGPSSCLMSASPDFPDNPIKEFFDSNPFEEEEFDVLIYENGKFQEARQGCRVVCDDWDKLPDSRRVLELEAEELAALSS